MNFNVGSGRCRGAIRRRRRRLRGPSRGRGISRRAGGDEVDYIRSHGQRPARPRPWWGVEKNYRRNTAFRLIRARRVVSDGQSGFRFLTRNHVQRSECPCLRQRATACDRQVGGVSHLQGGLEPWERRTAASQLMLSHVPCGSDSVSKIGLLLFAPPIFLGVLSC